MTLEPIANQLGLEGSYETGVFRPGSGDRDYRVPDLVFARFDRRSARGIDDRA